MSEPQQSEQPVQQPREDHFQNLTPQERYAIIIGRLEHEHDLSNARMNWLLTFQGFLLAAMAVFENGKQHLLGPSSFQRIVPLIGIISALSVLVGIIASRLARKELKALWKASGLLGFPELSPLPVGSMLGSIPSLIVPIVLILAWVFLWIAPLTNPGSDAGQSPPASALNQVSNQMVGTNVQRP